MSDGKGRAVWWGRKGFGMISVQIVIFTFAMTSRCDQKKAGVSQGKLTAHRKHFQGYVCTGGVSIALFLKTAVQHKEADIFDHFLVLELK